MRCVKRDNKRSWIKGAAVRILLVLLLCGILIADSEAPRAHVYAEAASPGADVSAIKAGDHIYMGNRGTPGYTGLPYWRVLDTDTDDGSLYLMSEYLWTGSDPEDFLQFNEIPAGGVPMEGYEELGYQVRGSAWQGSLAQEWCRGFESAVLSDVAGLTIKETTKTDDEFPSPDDPDITFAWTRNILNEDKVFFLSAEEAVHYMPAREDRAGILHDGSAPGERCDYWLRSPRLYTFSECAGKVLSYGDSRGMVARQTVSSLSAARPVFWALLDPDTPAIRCEHAGGVTWTIDPKAEAQGYSGIRYSWSAGNRTCTATAVCNNCGRTVSETVAATSEVTKRAEVLKDGVRSFTASFSSEPFTTQVRTAKIPKTYDPVAGIRSSKLPKVSLQKLIPVKRGFTARWKKLSTKKKKAISGIEVQYSLKKNFADKSKPAAVKRSKTVYKCGKLKSKKTYWVRVRTYKKKNGIKYVSAWSKAKKVRIK